MYRNTQNGFTLIELMVTLLVAAILLVVGVPAMGDFIKSTRLTATVNDFIAATTVARSEALKRRSPVTVCPSPNPLAASPACDTGASPSWEAGWVTFADTDGDAVIDAGEEILQRQGPLADSQNIRSAAALSAYISFSSAGETRTTAGASVTGDVVFCDDRGVVVTDAGTSAARAVSFSRTGRPRTLRYQDAITNTGISCP